jgi:ribosome recycling factor
MDALALEAQDKMGKSIESYEGALRKLRSGRANPAILSGIMCDYYGDKMDISSLCAISMPEPRQLLVRPYSREDLKTVAAAIGAANIGVNPQVEADAIRIIIPPLTEDVRRDIAKQAKGFRMKPKWRSATSAATTLICSRKTIRCRTTTRNGSKTISKRSSMTPTRRSTRSLPRNSKRS